MTARSKCFAVIASEAKQSIPSPRGDMDCFVEPVIGRPFRPTRWLAMTNPYSGAALSPRAFESLEANDATTITTAISAITSAQMALISGFTPSRTSE